MRNLIAFALVWFASLIYLATPAQAADCRITPQGLIAQRWLDLDGATGPLGCPISPETIIEGSKILPDETTGSTPVLAEHNGRLFIAWKGAGNSAINLMFSDDGGTSFHGKITLPETTEEPPAMVSHNGRLYLAWRGSGNQNISVAKVLFIGNTAGGFGIEGLEDKVVLGETTTRSPALASHAGRLFLAWKGAGNDAINLAFSGDDGRTFGGKKVFGETTDRAPALVSAGNRLLMAWKGSGNQAISVAGITLFGNTAGGFGIEGPDHKLTLGETTGLPPALGFHNGRVFLAWKGAGNDQLNMMLSRDAGMTFEGKRVLGDRSDEAPSMASFAGRLWVSWKGQGNEDLNLAKAVLFGNTAGGFGIESLEGPNAVKMKFEHGEIVWSPAQGPSMLVAAYQQEDNIIVNWGNTDPHNYDKFIVRWDRNGRNVGQADVDSYIEPNNGFFRIQAPLPARYSVVVEGCTTSTTGGSKCSLRFTVPVEVEYNLPALPVYGQCDAAFQPFGLIGERWAQLGGPEGPLGCPLEREHPVAGRAGAAQAFQHGEVSFSPNQGEQMMLAVYQRGGQVVADWGSTAPFSYDKFILIIDKNGQRIGQHDVGEGSAGSWSTDAATNVDPGRYTVAVEGCETDLTGAADCKQKWTIPASVTMPAMPDPPPFKTSCNNPPVGLILEKWKTLGAEHGLMGCPVGSERSVPGRRGKVLSFDNGEIVWSPEQGGQMVVAAYQDNNSIKVDWGDTKPFSYLFFIVRIEHDGELVGQTDVGGHTGATYSIGPTRPEKDASVPTVGDGAGRYTISVEGCEDGDVGTGADCDQGWTIPAAVVFQPASDTIDLADIKVPRSVAAALADKDTKALRAAENMVVAADLGDWGEGSNALAMLYLVDHSVVRGESPYARRRPGKRFGMLTEVNDAIRGQTINAKSGTDFHDIPGCERTGEYDFKLKGYIPIIYRYGRFLAPDVRYRLRHLLNKTGGHDTDDEGFDCFGATIPETENHLWMIDSSRYLTNQIWAKRSKEPRYDNRQNGLADYLVTKLQADMSHDFIEYNARPYGRLTWAAIQNLYDYSEDPRVKTAAQIVLDYLSAKVAVSAADGRRDPPYRRRVSNNHADFFNQQSDRLKKRFLYYTAPTSVMGEMRVPNRLEEFAASEVLWAGISSYQPPNLIIDMMVNPASRKFYQRLNYTTREVYASEPDFLISGGGVPADYAYKVKGAVVPLPGPVSNALTSLFADEDLGIAQPTFLMPTDRFTTVKQMIRFDRVASDKGDSHGTCVAPGFACGLKPVIPALYTAKAQCVRKNGKWTFIDFLSDRCRSPNPGKTGFFVAVFGAGEDFGFFEAVPKAMLDGITLRNFATITFTHNGSRSFKKDRENTYSAWGGNQIRFNPGADNPIVATGIPATDALFAAAPARLAAGTVLNSSGQSSAMTITNAATGDSLLIDLNDIQKPVRVLTERDIVGRLLAQGVDFSVPEADLRGWLVNNFTPYPAISGALFELLGQRGLKKQVYIDVISFNYEHAAGATSPRAVADVDKERLKAAIVEGYNTRYDEKNTSFDDLLR